MTNQKKHQITRSIFAGIIGLAFAYIFWPFITPLLLAAIFAFAFEPFFARKGLTRKKRRWTTVFLVIGIFLVFTLPVGFVVNRLVFKIKEVAKVGLDKTPIYQSVQVLVQKVSNFVINFSDQMHVDTSMIEPQEMINKMGTWLVGGVGTVVSAAPELVMAYFVFSAAFYFFLTESKTIKRVFLNFDLLATNELNEIVTTMQKSSFSILSVSIFVGSIQALVVSIGGAIFGYREFLILFVLTFFLSFIPVVGAAPVALVLSILSFIQNDIGSGIGLLVVAVIAGSIDNILKPFLVSSAEEEINPIISLLSIVGAVIVYGIPGLLLGPILLQLTFKIFPLLFNKKSDAPAQRPAP